MLKIEPQGITDNLAAGGRGYIRTSELSRDPVDDPKKPIGEEEETALEAYGAAGTATATTKLSDLLRPQLDVSETGKEHGTVAKSRNLKQA